MMSPDHAQPGNGLLLFFRVDDFDMALPRARALVARLRGAPREPNTGTTEFSLRDRTGITSRSVRSLRLTTAAADRAPARGSAASSAPLERCGT